MDEKIFSFLNYLQNNKCFSENWNISWLQGVILSNLVENFSPNRILEVGTSNGFSTLFLGLSGVCNNITSVEINESKFLEARENFKRCDFDVNLINLNIFDFLEGFNLLPFDFFFIDALQKSYLELIKKIFSCGACCSNSIFVFDNLVSHGVGGDLKDFFLNKGYLLEEILVGSGFLIAIKNS